MKVTEDIRNYAAEQGLSASQGREIALATKSKEFVENDAEVYAKA